MHFLQRRFAIAESNSSLWHVALKDSVNNSQPDWPLVSLAFEAKGIYFCDHLTATNEAAIVFRHLIDFLLLTNAKVEIEEL
ncbi:hypothetical protein J0X19_08515 [Hymenobacter sp. BT186]|uniref:Uncharacterized protein n=1 Tax=Hymenobacter telluris TaxID=2816474 RepID=A0A939J8P7_9BACT|nr:hypothetical protein [Hymenobacter telluris]MBO0357984.1 hypothetical protein [Hymenobacter telluris]MBW3374011.1 hypothetical protein [Hymenobacter norwichensis]